MDRLKKDETAVMQPDPEPPSAAKAQPYRKSAGDALFDIGVYGGIGYIANATISMAADRYATQLPESKLYKLGQQCEKGFTKLFNTFMKKPESVKYWSKKSNQIFFLGSGGWLLLLPMKWLEDRKVETIRGIDGTLGTGPQTPEGIEQQMQALDNGPRQSGLSLFGGRIVSYAATIAFALPFITKKTKVGQRFSEFLDRNLTHHMPASWSAPIKTYEDGRQVPQMMDSLGAEVILAGTAAGLHYGSSKLFAFAGHELKHRPAAGFSIEPQPGYSVHQVAAHQRLEAPEKSAERD